MSKCPKCGYENEDGAPFCNMCYEVLNKAAKAPSPDGAAEPSDRPLQPDDKPAQTGGGEEKVSAETLKKIEEGWTAAFVCGGFTFIAVIVASMVPSLADLISAWALVDVGLIFALGFGMRAKSRTAATLMFLYYLAAKLYQFSSTGKPSGLAITALFTYYFFRAMTATFDYHKELAS